LLDPAISRQRLISTRPTLPHEMVPFEVDSSAGRHIIARFRPEAGNRVSKPQIFSSLRAGLWSWSGSAMNSASTAITVAPFVGAAAATINPFNIGIAASRARVSIADRLGLRFTLLILSVAATVAYTL